MADLDTLCLFSDQRGEFFIDACFHQQARGRRAAFTIQRIDHEDGGIDSALQIGIGKDDHRVFAAKLKMHALQRIRPLLHDERACAAFAHKADGLDVGMLGQGLARIFPEAIDEVPYAFRQTGFLGNFNEQARRQR